MRGARRGRARPLNAEAEVEHTACMVASVCVSEYELRRQEVRLAKHLEKVLWIMLSGSRVWAWLHVRHPWIPSHTSLWGAMENVRVLERTREWIRLLTSTDCRNSR